MKGKVGFVLGAALGYVLGTRAGRARYEQIKRGATAVWETPLVQQGVTSVKGSVGDSLDSVKATAIHALKSAFDSATQSRATQSRAAQSRAPQSRASQNSSAHVRDEPGQPTASAGETAL